MELCVDGTDGAGKTPLVEALVAAVRARGRTVTTCAPYRVTEVFPLWKDEPVRAAETIADIMRRFREAHPGDVIVWDRGWPTAWVSTTDAIALGKLLPFPHLTVLLLNTTAITRMRARKHASNAPWMVEDELIEGFNAAYRALPDRVPAPLLAFEPDHEQRFPIDELVTEILAKAEIT